MIKLLIGILVTALTTFIGIRYSDRFAKRRIFYQNMRDFCNYYILNLSYKMDRVPEVMRAFSQKNDDASFIKTIGENIYKGEEIKISLPYLDESERKEAEKFFSSLGRSNNETEKKLLGSSLEMFRAKLCEAAEKEKKYRVPAIKLGFAAGMIIFIIII